MQRFNRLILYRAAGQIIHQGALLQAKIERLPEKRREKPPIRRATSKVWTRQSRARLAKNIYQLLPALKSGYNYAITLTYRQRTPAESKRDIHCLHRRLRRQFKNQQWFAIWKMEFQLRGVVHYHILLHTEYEQSVHELRQFISQAWAEISGDPQLAETGTRVDPLYIQTVHHAIGYLLKHAAALHKAYQNQAPEEVQWAGRWWGIWNKPKLPTITLQASYRQIHQLKRYLAKIRPISKKSRSSYWAYCEPELFLRLINLIFNTQEISMVHQHPAKAQRPSSPTGIQAAPNPYLLQVHPP